MTGLWTRFVQNRSGATAIEYSVIASLIAVVVITAANGIATQMGATFSKVNAEPTHQLSITVREDLPRATPGEANAQLP